MELDTIELREIFGIIRKRLLLIAIIVLAAIITAGVISYFVLDKEYQATTSLILGKPNDFSSNPQLQYNDVLLYQKLVKTYGEIAKSRTVSEKVIDAMKLNMTAEQLQARRFGGNGDVLCDIGRSGCAFVRVQGSDKAFCLLYNNSLSYVETGNNDICSRCDNCLRDSQQPTDNGGS